MMRPSIRRSTGSVSRSQLTRKASVAGRWAWPHAERFHGESNGPHSPSFGSPS